MSGISSQLVIGVLYIYDPLLPYKRQKLKCIFLEVAKVLVVSGFQLEVAACHLSYEFDDVVCKELLLELFVGYALPA